MTVHALRTQRPNPPHRSLPYLLTFPALIALIGILYPFVLGVYYTFTNYTLTEPGNIRLVGLANYIEIFKNIDFWKAFSLTFVFAGSVVVIELVVGLGVALLLKDAFPGVRILRSFLVIPMMIPPIVSALMWKVILLPTDQGVLNHILSFVRIRPIAWLGDSSTALLPDTY
jgi:multiple sugar transport system permease protein